MSTYVGMTGRRAAVRRSPPSQELFESISGDARRVNGLQIDMSPFPFRVASAAGSELVDADGITYVDFLATIQQDCQSRPCTGSGGGDWPQHGWSFGEAH